MREVTHLITGLGKGGSETMLYQVLKYKKDSMITYRVISLGGSHYYEDLIRSLGVELLEVHYKQHPLASTIKIIHFLKQTQTEVLCCWMYHANFVGYIVGKHAKIDRLIWNIRHSNIDVGVNKGMTLMINKICARLSKKVSAIAYNGRRARQVHEALGYYPVNAVTLDNGVDTDEYNAMPDARKKIYAELGLNDEKKLVLSVTKFHPMKDVPTFVKAFAKMHYLLPNTVAVMCGNGIESSNQELVNLCQLQGLHVGEDLFLLGLRHDVPFLMSAANLYVLHSVGEAFPNTLIQAMSCKCLCITTDVGDARRILSQDDLVVSPGDVSQLSLKMNELLTLSDEEADRLRYRNCARVKEQFDIRRIVQDYEELFLE